MRNHRNALAAVLLAVGLAACGGTTPPQDTPSAQGVSVDVQPAQVDLKPGGTASFASAVTGTVDTSVTWEVVEVGGGTIDATGQYSAPQTVGQYHVRAVSHADPSVQGVATVTVSATAPPTQPPPTQPPPTQPPPTQPPPTQGPQAACATAPLRTTGPVYYYCDCGTGAAAGCVPGNDSNAGTSPSTPRQTLGNAASRFNGMAAGSTVALCRGGAWSGGFGGLHNSSCGTSDSTTCDLRDYTPSWGSASTPRPRLNGAGTGAFNLTTGQGYRIWNLDIRGTSGADNGIFYVNIDGSGVHDVDVCNVQIDTMRLGFNLIRGSFRGNSNFVIRNSQFYRSSFCAIYGGMDGLTVDSNYFEDNGTTATPQTHTIYLAEYADGMKFINNDVTASPSVCGGVQVVLHMSLTNVTLENNRIYSPSTNVNCYGIQTSYSMVSWAQFDNTVVRRNRITRAPGFSGNSMEILGCVNCTVSDNILVNGAFTVGTGSCGGNLACTSGTVVQNNSVIGSMGIGGSNNTVENNAVAGSCNVGGTTLRAGNNVCNVSASTAWVDAAGGNFKPASGGPLIGAASQTNYSPIAVGSIAWSPTDDGVARALPVDAGAMQH